MSKKKIILILLSVLMASLIGAVLGIIKYRHDYTYALKDDYSVSEDKDETDEKANTTNTNKDDNNIDVTKLEKLDCELTAYCSCYECSMSFGRTTALETEAKIGVVAAPPDIPLGTMLYIPSLKYLKEDGIFYVEDRGEAVKVKENNVHIIDVYLPEHQDTIEFGRKKADVYIIK